MWWWRRRKDEGERRREEEVRRSSESDGRWRQEEGEGGGSRWLRAGLREQGATSATRVQWRLVGGGSERDAVGRGSCWIGTSTVEGRRAAAGLCARAVRLTGVCARYCTVWTRVWSVRWWVLWVQPSTLCSAAAAAPARLPWRAAGSVAGTIRSTRAGTPCTQPRRRWKQQRALQPCSSMQRPLRVEERQRYDSELVAAGDTNRTHTGAHSREGTNSHLLLLVGPLLHGRCAAAAAARGRRCSSQAEERWTLHWRTRQQRR